MAKKRVKKKNRKNQYIEQFDPVIFDKLVNIKDLSYEEILVLEEEMKNNPMPPPISRITPRTTAPTMIKGLADFLFTGFAAASGAGCASGAG